MDEGGPKRAGLVLLALILVAAVANLNLAVANVALPDIGKAFDASQTTLNLVAVGYSLGLAASVLYLGALGDRYGRKMMLLLGMALSIPQALIAAFAPSIGVLFAARLIGGVSAGMAFPTTLALITALWSGASRTRAIALWSAIGGAIAALGPLISGALLEHFDWGSVFLVTLPLAAVALFLAWRYVPAHVNETTARVDNWGGVLSIAMVATLVMGISLAPAPGKLGLAIGLCAIALAAAAAFVLRQRRAPEPLYDLDVARRRVFWVAACAGIIVFGSLMAAMFVGQQFLQNMLGYSTLGSGAAILPAAVLMVIVAPRSAKLVEVRGARFTLLLGYVFCLLGFLTMLLLWKEGIDYWKVGLGYGLVGIGVGFAGTPGLALVDRLGAGDPGRHGLRHRRLAARPRRRDHAVDPRRPSDRRLRGGGQRGDRRLTRPGPGHRERRIGIDQVLLERRRHRQPVPEVRRPDSRRGEGLLPARRRLGLQRRHRRRAARRRPRILLLPEGRGGEATVGALPRRGRQMSYRLLRAGEAHWRPSNQMQVLNTDLAKQLDASALAARMWRFAPGQASTKHRHDEQEELYVLLEGTGRVRVGEEALTLAPLDSLLVEPDTVRQLFNDTDADQLWLVLAAPPVQVTSTLEMDAEQLRRLYPDGPKALPPELVG
jgi:MFS family permease/quercetin dioxygenase-like cupin family protein